MSSVHTIKKIEMKSRLIMSKKTRKKGEKRGEEEGGGRGLKAVGRAGLTIRPGRPGPRAHGWKGAHRCQAAKIIAIQI